MLDHPWRVWIVFAVLLLGATGIFSLTRTPETTKDELPVASNGDATFENTTTELAGFRVTQGKLYEVTARGQARLRPVVEGMPQTNIPVVLYDWNLNREPAVLLGVSEEGSEESPAALVLLQGTQSRKIAANVVAASLSGDAKFVSYVTADYAVVVADTHGGKIAEFRDCVEVRWYGDKVILTHAVDGMGSDSSSATELLLASRDGLQINPLVPDTFNAHHPAVSPGRSTVLFASGKTGVSSFYRIDLPSGRIVQLTNIDQTSFGSDSVPVPAKPGRWSPDGRFYAYDVWHGSMSEVWVVGIDPGQVRKVGTGMRPLWLDDARIGVTDGVRGEERVISLQQ